MKRLIFLTTFDYPSRYAHAIHGQFMARAFHKALGDNFLFIVNTCVDETLRGIPVRRLFGRFGRRLKKLHLRSFLLPWSMMWFFIQNPMWQGSTLFLNDPKLIWVACYLQKIFRTPFIFESHGVLSPAKEKKLTERAERIIFLTSFLRDDFLARHPGVTVKTLVLSNAVDTTAFNTVTDDIASLRREFQLPNGFLIGYVGRFEPRGEDKGVRFLIDTLRDLPQTVQLLLVGGDRREIQKYAAYCEERAIQNRVILIPHVEPAQVSAYEKACDVLAYVPTGTSLFYERETSPMKVYEYMASGRPMILSNLPTLSAVVPADAAFFIAPGSKEQFISVVEEVKKDGRARAERAAVLVAGNSWNARAERIIAL
jgi:glycosyltransferase involved in cell wall biosynthesis